MRHGFTWSLARLILMNILATFAILSGARLDGDSGTGTGGLEGLPILLPLWDRKRILEARREGGDAGGVLVSSELRLRNRFMVKE